MKALVQSRAVFLATLAFASSAYSQDLSRSVSPFENSTAQPSGSSRAFSNGNPIQPLVGVSPENYASDKAWYLVQDQATLAYSEAPAVTRPLSLESQLRRNASPLLKLPSSAQGEIKSPARELNFALSLLAAMYRSEDAPINKSSPEDLEYALSIRHKIRETPENLLAIVASEITSNPDRVCEIVKASIKACDGKAETIASIVETAATTRPESMRLAAQCAMATSPESLSAVQSVMAKLDPASGDSSGDSKDAKGSVYSSKTPEKGTVIEKASDADPLDTPRYTIPPPPLPPGPPPPPPPATKCSFPPTE